METRMVSQVKESITRSTIAIAITMCLITLGVRVIYSAFPTKAQSRDEWDHIAANLATGQGYVSSWAKTHIRPSILNLSNDSFPAVPTATRVPVPVFYFALMYRLFGINDDSLVIGQWILDILTCTLLFVIALRVFGDKRVAALTSMIWAFYVPELWMSNSCFSEPMTAFILACLVYVLLVALDTLSVWRFGLAGAIWGLAMLCRPTMIVLPLFLFPVLVVLLRRCRRLALLACTTIILGGILTISPWVYRNFKVFDAFIPTSTLGGQNLFRDHYLIDRDDYLCFRDTAVVEEAAKEMLDRRFGSAVAIETADNTWLLIDRIYREEAIAKIGQYPSRYVLLSLVRVLRLWFNVGYGAPPSWRSYLILIGHLILLGLVVKAFVSYRGNWLPKMAPATALVVHHTLSYMAIAGEFRYSIPLAPYPIMVSCHALICIFEKNRFAIVDQVLPNLKRLASFQNSSQTKKD